MGVPRKLIKVRYLVLALVIGFQVLFLHKLASHSFLAPATSDVMIYDQSQSSLTYKLLLKSFPPKEFIKRPVQDRCDMYFDELFKLDENWKIPDLQGMDYSLDVFDRNRFYNSRYDKLKKQYEEEQKPVSDIDTRAIFDDLSKRTKMNEDIENALVDALGHLRIYGQCYLHNSKQQSHSKSLEIESRLFPFLTFEPPISERWDGTVVNDFLDISKFYQYPDMNISPKDGENDKRNAKIGEYFNLYNLKYKMKGRGIVISMGDQFINDVVNLIKVLRYERNQLPIQFVHKGDLAEDVKAKIIDLARNNIFIPKMNLLIDSYPQEVWFVNANRCFVQDYYYKFSHYANKWVAVLFNSFEEMILMDTDAVPFLPPANFFSFLESYKETGAYFFKDRETTETIPNEHKNIFKKMLPTEIEHTFFNIPVSTSHTLDNKFMKENHRHFMEAGILLMNRRKHLLGILMSVQIQFWGPLTTFVWGEKELFWLGQSIAGDENYSYNNNPVGAIGVIQKRDKFPDSIVGCHPAHVADDDQTLLWVNSGMEVCKTHSWADDFRDINYIKSRFQTEEEVKEYYLSPLHIEDVLIPPDGNKNFPAEGGLPSRGWLNRQDVGCRGYNWMAYYHCGMDDENPESYGKEIRFTQEQQDLYNTISKIWVYEAELNSTVSVHI